MHTTWIDWGGFIPNGEIGQVYTLSWDEDDEEPIDYEKKNQFIFENESEVMVAIRAKNGNPLIRCYRTPDIIPIEECRKIAKIQVEKGYTTWKEIKKQRSRK